MVLADQSTEIHFKVFTPGGLPAAGAQAILIQAGQYAWISDCASINENAGGHKIVADPDGCLHFPAVSGPFLIAIFHPTGCAQVDGGVLAKSSNVTLKEYGKIDGQYFVGRHPAAGEKINASVEDERIYDPHLPTFHYIFSARTGPDGRFVFERVPAGKITVDRRWEYVFDNGKPAGIGSTQKQKLTLHPGQTATVTLGGMGRQVTGRVIIPPELIAHKNWSFFICSAGSGFHVDPPPMPPEIAAASLSDRIVWFKQFAQTAQGQAYAQAVNDNRLNGRGFPLRITHDGVFAIDDVPAGKYGLGILIINLPESTGGFHDLLADGHADFEVPLMPAGRSDEPLVIPDLHLEMRKPVPHPGDPAPDFMATTFSGKTLKLSDFLGKYVLLDFWDSGCGCSKRETDHLKAIDKQYGQTGRLVMISLSLDELPYEPAKYIHDHGMTWPQCFLGAKSSIPKDYGMRGFPSVWLIGPEGRIIASPYWDDKMSAALAAIPEK